MIGTRSSWFATWRKKSRSRLRFGVRGCDAVVAAVAEAVADDADKAKPTTSALASLSPPADVKLERDNRRNNTGTTHFVNLISTASLPFLDHNTINHLGSLYN